MNQPPPPDSFEGSNPWISMALFIPVKPKRLPRKEKKQMKKLEKEIQEVLDEHPLPKINPAFMFTSNDYLK